MMDIGKRVEQSADGGRYLAELHARPLQTSHVRTPREGTDESAHTT
jgi:hypothetical protein